MRELVEGRGFHPELAFSIRPTGAEPKGNTPLVIAWNHIAGLQRAC